MAVFFEAFKLHDTHGIPLSFQLHIFKTRYPGSVVSVPAFFRDALRAGWRREKARAVAEEALVDDGLSGPRIQVLMTWLDSLTATSSVPGEEGA